MTQVLSALVPLLGGSPLLAMSVVVSIFKGILMALFIVCAVVLMVVILLQEGKGGGIAGAFGGAAADTFGVKAGTVNRFTAILATVFIGLALLHAGVSSATVSVIATTPIPSTPAEDGASPPMPPPIVVPPTSPPVTPPAMDPVPPAMEPPALPTPPPAPPPVPPPAMEPGMEPPPAPPPEKPADDGMGPK